MSKIYIYGKHAVSEALIHAPRSISKVHLAPNMKDKELHTLIERAGIRTEELDSRRVSSMVEGNAPHQGVVALLTLGNLAVPAEKFIEELNVSKETLLVFLAGITDPHNVGTIIRSAASLGASAVLLPAHKQSPITGAVVKASAGAAFQLPLVMVTNEQQSIAQLKKKGVRVCGLAADGAVPLSTEIFEGATMLVFGNEAEGIPPSARALCDAMISIPLTPKAESLNVAASAAIALYAWRLTR